MSSRSLVYRSLSRDLTVSYSGNKTVGGRDSERERIPLPSAKLRCVLLGKGTCTRSAALVLCTALYFETV